MSAISESIFTICVVLVAIEMLCRFASESNALQFICGLITAMLLISLVSAFLGFEFDFSEIDQSYVGENTELEEYLNDTYQTTVETETSAYIDGLLKTIEINAVEIEVFTDNDADDSIIIKKISVEVQNETDRVRADALLRNVMDEDTGVEVYVN